MGGVYVGKKIITLRDIYYIKNIVEVVYSVQ
jgi:hypothetical protein